MASIDSLPPDQRAVLQMVLGRGRGYDDIARMLSIDRAGVRDRALAALDALGPSTQVSAQRRHLIVDYLLGQLPPQVAEETRNRLGQSPSERAWARVVASELASLASGPMPAIPTEAAPTPEPAAAPEPVPARRRAPAVPAEPEPARDREQLPSDHGLAEPVGARPAPRVSRLGGAILLGVGAVVVIVVLIVVLSSSGATKHNHPPASAGTTATTASTPTTTSTGTSTSATPVAQINLVSPSGSKTTAGIAEVLRRGSTTAVAIVGQGLPANTKHNAYAVWLYNSPSDAYRLGFVNPGVGKTGRLETAGPLPTTAARFKQLLVTLETTANPKAPGPILLEGALTGLS
jgi:hypothetical protein